MKRTISLKIGLEQEQSDHLLETQKHFANACNQIVPFVVENRCWNRVEPHIFFEEYDFEKLSKLVPYE